MTVRSPNQLLTFVLGTENYGFDVLCVQEIRGWARVRRIAHAPAHLLGVLNVRGSIIPVVDLQTRLSLEAVKYDAVTEIIRSSSYPRSVNRVIGALAS